MDLLEYQGKQLFAKHGIAVPSGEVAATVEEAVAAGLEHAQARANAASAAGARDRETFMGRRTFPAMDIAAQGGNP